MIKEISQAGKLCCYIFDCNILINNKAKFISIFILSYFSRPYKKSNELKFNIVKKHNF